MPLALDGLPYEIQAAIIEEMDVPSLIALYQTNRHFHKTCDPRHEKRRAKLRTWLLDTELERIPRPPSEEDGGESYDDSGHDDRKEKEKEKNQKTESPRVLACFLCWRLRPIGEFAEKQTKKRRRAGGSEAGQRFCVDCGIAHEKYSPGSAIVRGRDGQQLFVCIECREATRPPFCEYCLRCSDCARYSAAAAAADANGEGHNMYVCMSRSKTYKKVLDAYLDDIDDSFYENAEIDWSSD